MWLEVSPVTYKHQSVHGFSFIFKICLSAVTVLITYPVMCDRDTAEVPVPILDLNLSISQNYCFHFLPLFTWHKRCQEMENCKWKKKNTEKKISKTSESSVMKGPEIFSVQSVLVHSANDCHGDLPDVE